jgi:hypothetical protein
MNPAPQTTRMPVCSAPLAPRRPCQLSQRRLLTLLATTGLLLLALCSSALANATVARRHGASHRTAHAAQAGLPVTVAIDRLDPGAPVPEQFIGLSFEAAALSQMAQYANRGDLVELLRSLGPGLLRFGGITADENVAWSDAETPRPAWATSTIGPEQMRALGLLARRSGWHVLLTVGLAHYEPAAAAREVASAHAALGPYLTAVEIGNEPNSYASHGLRELPWTAQGYEEQVTIYREAIEALTPEVPIAGPDVSGSGIFIEWGSAEALSQVPDLLTGHHYPLGCAQTPAPSIEELLSATTRGREARSIATYMSVAKASGIPLRIDETNSVSCGGVPGISDTFASALWASAYLTQTMSAGPVGINLQGNPGNCAGYTPICAPNPAALAAGTLRAQPEWYALLLTRSLVGYRPLPTTISATGVPNFVAASFSGPEHSLQVVLVDDEPPGSSPLALQLDVGSELLTQGKVMRLTATSPSATDGVLLAGSQVAANGSWAAPKGEAITAHAGVLPLELEPSSAALVTVSRAKPKPRHRRRAHRQHKARRSSL